MDSWPQVVPRLGLNAFTYNLLHTFKLCRYIRSTVWPHLLFQQILIEHHSIPDTVLGSGDIPGDSGVALLPTSCVDMDKSLPPLVAISPSVVRVRP